MSIIDTLITDRTGGSYNASDLNRVCEAITYLKTNLNAITTEINNYLDSHNVASDSLFTIQHNIIEASLITETWSVGYIPSKAELDSVIECLKQIKNAINVETSDIPDSYDSLTVSGANAIEEMMQVVEAKRIEMIAKCKELIDLASAREIYSDELYGGESE